MAKTQQNVQTRTNAGFQRPLAGPGAPLPSIPSQNTSTPVRRAPAAPANQQRFSRESVKFKQQRQQSIVQPNINALRKQMEQSSGFKNRRISREMQQEQHLDLGFLTQRQGGAAMVQRESVRGN